MTELLRHLNPISLIKSPADLEIKIHRPDIAILAAFIAAGSQAIAEVMMQKAGPDGIKIDQANGPSPGLVKEEIFDLRIAVNRADRERPPFAGRLEERCPRPELLDLGKRVLHPGGKIPFAQTLSHSIKFLEIARQDMKAGQRHLKGIAGDVRDQSMKQTKEAADL
jgi:hypothetical protein